MTIVRVPQVDAAILSPAPTDKHYTLRLQEPALCGAR